jgi:hypothetical protein
MKLRVASPNVRRAINPRYNSAPITLNRLRGRRLGLTMASLGPSKERHRS